MSERNRSSDFLGILFLKRLLWKGFSRSTLRIRSNMILILRFSIDIFIVKMVAKREIQAVAPTVRSVF